MLQCADRAGNNFVVLMAARCYGIRDAGGQSRRDLSGSDLFVPNLKVRHDDDRRRHVGKAVPSAFGSWDTARVLSLEPVVAVTNTVDDIAVDGYSSRSTGDA